MENHNKNGVPGSERIFKIQYGVQSSSGGFHYAEKIIKGYDAAQEFVNGLYDPKGIEELTKFPK